jgi:hypothetical protein
MPSFASFGQKVFVQGGQNAFHRQSDDIAHRAFNAFDQPSSVLLGGITSRFVEGMDAPQIVLKINCLPRAEFHPRGFDKAEEFPFALLHEADARQHFVNSTTKPFQHGPRFVEIARLSKDLPLERDHRVGAQNNAVWKPRGNFHRLALRVEQAEFPRRPPSSG